MRSRAGSRDTSRLYYGYVIVAAAVAIQLLAGYVFDVAGSYDVVFVILSAVAAIAMSLVAALKPIPMKEQGG